MQVQHQSEFEKDRIKSIGISLADGKFGPFELLIDEINVLSGDDYWEYLNRARNLNTKTLKIETDNNNNTKLLENK